MRKLLYAIAGTLFVFQFAFKDKSVSIYEGCCGTAATIDSFRLDTTSVHFPFDTFSVHVYYSTVYIPNIFVPDPMNIRGTYSSFSILVGYGFQRVLSMKCMDEGGDILFQKEDYFPNGDDLNEGWSGEKPDGSFHYGAFKYEVQVRFLDDQIKTYTGTACSYECGANDFPKVRLPDCFFPTQNNGNGGFDPNQPFEKQCFE